MPELPEVETTRMGISPLISGRRISDILIRDHRLRWPIDTALPRQLRGQRIIEVRRRAKYLLLVLERGTLIMHLGMSGSLRVLARESAPQKHDHLDLVLDNDQCLRLRDPRRFGTVLYTEDDPARHPLLAQLGPEPLSGQFTGDYLLAKSRGRKLAVKSFLMDSKVVVGVGNIYANEALFLAGIHPTRAAGRIGRERYQRLCQACKRVLKAAIKQGGTTLRDFTNSEGKPGYFRHRLKVYDREGEPCPRCATPIRHRVIGQRSSFYCPQCQR